MCRYYLPKDKDDQHYFDIGVRWYQDGRQAVPYPGADTHADMWTNQGWLFEKYRQEDEGVK